MSSSQINTLFTTAPRTRPASGFFIVSIFMHGLVIATVVLTIIDAPRVDTRPPAQRYTTRIVKLQSDEPQLRWSPGHDAAPPSPHRTMPAAHSGAQRAAAAAPQSLAYRTSAPITIVQPEIAQKTLLALKAPVPLMVLWTPQTLPDNKIVPPPPHVRAAAPVRPSLAMPNHETEVANLELSSTSFVSQTLQIHPSTTSPIRMPGVTMPQVPETTSKAAEPATAATVLSVSNVLLARGTVALPSINQTAAASASDSFAPGQAGGVAEANNGAVLGKQNGTQSGHGSGGQENQSAAASGQGGEKGAQAGSNSGPGTQPSSDGQFSVVRISRSKDGHFGVVVVGDAVADAYPEAAGLWADRLAYTVYLHVGAAKNWILQYSLPRAAHAAGNSTRPDAPWPYLIVTPHIPAEDLDTDALLVHGFIDPQGHFKQLAIVYPPQFAQTKFVLNALQQWEFRPAAQNGQSTTVEVLLIIPEDGE